MEIPLTRATTVYPHRGRPRKEDMVGRIHRVKNLTEFDALSSFTLPTDDLCHSE